MPRFPRKRKAIQLSLAGFLAAGCAATATAGDNPPFKILKLEGHALHWQGAPKRVITYRVLEDPREFPGARNCMRLTGLGEILKKSGVTPEIFHGELAEAFAMWEKAADIHFQKAADPAHADIVIGAQQDPEGWAFANVFYDVKSPETVKPITQALICLNPQKAWKVGFDGDLRTYDLRYTLAHEIGHAIGLDHPPGGGVIMAYRYEERFRELQPGDTAGVIQIYGAAKTGTAAAPAEQKPQAAGITTLSITPAPPGRRTRHATHRQELRVK